MSAHRYRIFLLVFAMFMLGCQQSGVVPTAPGVTPLPTYPLLSAPTPASTIDIPPVAEPIDLSAWAFAYPNDPNLADVIVFQNDDYLLDPNWQVRSIEYLFTWSLYGDSVIDHQIIEQQSNNFYRNGMPVDSALVQQFLGAISHLHTSQAILAGNVDMHSSPSWNIEIVGVDGRHLWLYSFSTANYGAAPWNVLNNGYLYAQYDGTIAEPIAELFPSPQQAPTPKSYQGWAGPETTTFVSYFLPPQIESDFVGLLPVVDEFAYVIDTNTFTLHGYISPLAAWTLEGIAGSPVNRFDLVELTTASGTVVTCTTDDMTDRKAWHFACRLRPIKIGQRYQYGLTITFGTEEGSSVTTSGQLKGVLTTEPSTILMRPPDETMAALLEHDGVRNILEDHILISTDYVETIQSGKWWEAEIVGEAVWAGQFELNGNAVRYTIGTPFVIQQGKLTYWTLTAEAIQTMIDEIRGLALTQRIYNAEPSATLNLWYAESIKLADAPQVPNVLVNVYPQNYLLYIAPCADAVEQTLPAPDKPLQAFSFNSHHGFGSVDFVLIDHKQVVATLDWRSEVSGRRALLSVLVPDELSMEGHLPFESISIYHNGSDKNNLPMLQLSLPWFATPEDRDAFSRAADSLPATIEKLSDNIWQVSNMTFTVTDNGEVEAVVCNGSTGTAGSR